MKKLNNKGFSVVEITLSFVFIFTIAFAMYGLLLNYRNKQNEESIKTQMIDYTNQITLAVQNDITEKVLKDISYCVTDDYSCIKLLFNDGSEKLLSINDGVKDYDGEVYDIKYIEYGDIIYESVDAILLDISPNLVVSGIGDECSNGVKVFNISIPIYHNDLEGNYGINVTSVGYNSCPQISI